MALAAGVRAGGLPRITVTIVDRHIAFRFLWNFLVLFALLFVFAIAIDVILQLDRFMEAAEAAVGRGDYPGLPAALLAAVFNFHGPRIFQFYAYLLGLVSVAAMGFTLAQMHRHRELLALLAAGVSLPRMALPILAVGVGLNAIQVVNAELVVPRLAALLSREHSDILAPGVRSFPIPLTPDGEGRLVAAESFDPTAWRMTGLLVIERDERGSLLRRVVAESATWDPRFRSWRLENGRAIARAAGPDGAGLDPRAAELGGAASVVAEPVGSVETPLDPDAISVRRSAPYAQMLSVAQLRRLERSGGVDRGTVQRATWGRFATALANLVILVLAMPSFLLREPANLLRQAVSCSALAIAATLLVLVGLTIALPGVPTVVSVFAPVAILAPAALGRLLGVRT